MLRACFNGHRPRSRAVNPELRALLVEFNGEVKALEGCGGERVKLYALPTTLVNIADGQSKQLSSHELSTAFAADNCSNTYSLDSVPYVERPTLLPLRASGWTTGDGSGPQVATKPALDARGFPYSDW